MRRHILTFFWAWGKTAILKKQLQGRKIPTEGAGWYLRHVRTNTPQWADRWWEKAQKKECDLRAHYQRLQEHSFMITDFQQSEVKYNES